MTLKEFSKLKVAIDRTQDALLYIGDAVLNVDMTEEIRQGVALALGCVLSGDEMDAYDAILELEEGQAYEKEVLRIARWLSTEPIFRVEVSTTHPAWQADRVSYVEATSVADAASLGSGSVDKHVVSCRRATKDDAEEVMQLDPNWEYRPATDGKGRIVCP